MLSRPQTQTLKQPFYGVQTQEISGFRNQNFIPEKCHFLFTLNRPSDRILLSGWAPKIKSRDKLSSLQGFYCIPSCAEIQCIDRRKQLRRSSSTFYYWRPSMLLKLRWTDRSADQCRLGCTKKLKVKSLLIHMYII